MLDILVTGRPLWVSIRRVYVRRRLCSSKLNLVKRFVSKQAPCFTRSPLLYSGRAGKQENKKTHETGVVPVWRRALLLYGRRAGKKESKKILRPRVNGVLALTLRFLRRPSTASIYCICDLFSGMHRIAQPNNIVWAHPYGVHRDGRRVTPAWMGL